MDTDRYRYICSLIINCAAYRIGGPLIHERIISQSLPDLQRHYPERTWTSESVRRLFETNGLLDAIGVDRIKRSIEHNQIPPVVYSSKCTAQPSSENLIAYYCEHIEPELKLHAALVKRMNADDHTNDHRTAGTHDSKKAIHTIGPSPVTRHNRSSGKPTAGSRKPVA